MPISNIMSGKVLRFHQMNQISIEAAALALGSDLATARQRTGITDEHVLLYREQVAIAQTLTSRHFLDTACDPRLPAPDRRAFIDSQIQKALNVPAAHPNVWRATGRVWTVTRALADELLDAAFIGRKPSDSVFQLLQYSSLADGQGLPGPIRRDLWIRSAHSREPAVRHRTPMRPRRSRETRTQPTHHCPVRTSGGNRQYRAR